MQQEMYQDKETDNKFEGSVILNSLNDDTNEEFLDKVDIEPLR